MERDIHVAAVDEVRGHNACIPFRAGHPGSTKALHPAAQRPSIRVIHAGLPFGLEALSALLVLQSLNKVIHVTV